MNREQARASTKAAVRLASITSMISRVCMVVRMPSIAIPALLTSTSIRPNRSPTSSQTPAVPRDYVHPRPSTGNWRRLPARSILAMKAVFVRLRVATPYRRSRNPVTSSAPNPRLPPLTRAIFLPAAMAVMCLGSARSTGGVHNAARPNGRPIAQFLETRTVMLLRHHVDDGRNLVALEPCLAVSAHAPFERFGILRHQRGDFDCNHLAGDGIGGRPCTVTSLMLLSSRRTFSTSVGCTFCPPTLISSDFRPSMRIYSPSLSTRSWVLNQPSVSNGGGAFR